MAGFFVENFGTSGGDLALRSADAERLDLIILEIKTKVRNVGHAAALDHFVGNLSQKACGLAFGLNHADEFILLDLATSPAYDDGSFIGGAIGVP